MNKNQNASYITSSVLCKDKTMSMPSMFFIFFFLQNLFPHLNIYWCFFKTRKVTAHKLTNKRIKFIWRLIVMTTQQAVHAFSSTSILIGGKGMHAMNVVCQSQRHILTLILTHLITNLICPLFCAKFGRNKIIKIMN